MDPFSPHVPYKDILHCPPTRPCTRRPPSFARQFLHSDPKARGILPVSKSFKAGEPRLVRESRKHRGFYPSAMFTPSANINSRFVDRPRVEKLPIVPFIPSTVGTVGGSWLLDNKVVTWIYLWVFYNVTGH